MRKSTAKIICQNLIDKSKDMTLEGYHDIDENTFILKFSTKYEDIYLPVTPSKHDRESLIKYIINNKY